MESEHFLVVWTEAETVTLYEAVGHTPNLPRGGLETVYLTWEEGRGSEGLLVAVCWTLMTLVSLWYCLWSG